MLREKQHAKSLSQALHFDDLTDREQRVRLVGRKVHEEHVENYLEVVRQKLETTQVLDDQPRRGSLGVRDVSIAVRAADLAAVPFRVRPRALFLKLDMQLVHPALDSWRAVGDHNVVAQDHLVTRKTA